MVDPASNMPRTLIEDERGIVTDCCGAPVEVTRVVRDLVSYSPHELDAEDQWPTLIVKFDRVDSSLDSDAFEVHCTGCRAPVDVEVDEG